MSFEYLYESSDEMDEVFESGVIDSKIDKGKEVIRSTGVSEIVTGVSEGETRVSEGDTGVSEVVTSFTTDDSDTIYLSDTNNSDIIEDSDNDSDYNDSNGGSTIFKSRPKSNNDVKFYDINIQTRKTIIMRIKQLIEYHNSKIDKRLDSFDLQSQQLVDKRLDSFALQSQQLVDSENNKIDSDECLDYAKNFIKYQAISSFQNAKLAFGCFTKEYNIKVDDCIYSKYKSNAIKISELNKNEIKKKLFDDFPKLKEYKNDIHNFYDQNNMRSSRTSAIGKWCVSVCVVAHKNKINIDIRKQFPYFNLYSLIYREIVNYNLDYPLSDSIKSNWNKKILKLNANYKSKYKFE